MRKKYNHDNNYGKDNNKNNKVMMEGIYMGCISILSDILQESQKFDHSTLERCILGYVVY